MVEFDPSGSEILGGGEFDGLDREFKARSLDSDLPELYFVPQPRARFPRMREVALPLWFFWLFPTLFSLGFGLGWRRAANELLSASAVVSAPVESLQLQAGITAPLGAPPSTPEAPADAPTDSANVNATPTAAAPQPNVVIHTIKRGDLLIEVLKEYGVPSAEVMRMKSAALKAYIRLGQTQEGHPLRLSFDGGELVKYEYVESPENVKVLERVRHDGALGEWTARVAQLPYTETLRSAVGVITNNLYDSGEALGLPQPILYQLATIFQWDIDFNLALRDGDGFALVYRERIYQDPLAGEKPIFQGIVGAKFTNQGIGYYGIQFGPDPNAYYDLTGRSMRKQFLKSPLPIGQVTSQFSQARMHPVLGVKRPHYGVDIGAPTGTEIYATAAGVITFVGTNGGYGKMVEITHLGGYHSEYGHMSRFASGAVNGRKVKQGEVIGYVGSTGLSTGPHVHYGLRQVGKWVDPMQMKSLPAEPLSKSRKRAFDAHKKPIQASLDALIPEVGVAVQPDPLLSSAY